MFFGGYNCIPGYQFSPMTWSVCSSNPFHSLNLMWNDGMMKLQCDSLLYQSPSGGIFGNFFPIFSNYDSFTPNMLAQQTFAQFQQNNWWSNPTIGGANTSWNPWNNDWNPWANNNNGNDNGNSGNTVEKKKINTLKSIIAQLKKDDEDFWTNDKEDAYKAALKKRSDQEKIDGLEEILKDVDVSKIQKVIAEDGPINKILYRSGYNIELKSESNWNWTKELAALYSEVNKKGNNQLNLVASHIISNIGEKNDILQAISTWNDIHKGANEKGILRFIANRIPSKLEERTPYATMVGAIAGAYIDKAKEYPDSEAVKTKLAALDKATENINTKFKNERCLEKVDIIALANKCDALYAELRILDAQKADKAINKKYGFLNEINKDLVKENAILEKTKKDLKSENIQVPKISSEAKDDVDAKDNTDNSSKTKREETVDLNQCGEMEELADELGLEESVLKGWYKKGNKVYKYNKETEQFELQEGVTMIYSDGRIKKNGKTVSAREVDEPESSGKVLREKLGGDTNNANYDIARKKLNSFSQYTSAEDIYDFFKSYNEEKPWYAIRNSKITAQIVTENGMQDAEKKKWIKVIAKQAMVLAKKAGIDTDSDTYITLKSIENETFESSAWDDFWTHVFFESMLSTARKLDYIIDEIMEAYDAKNNSEQKDDTDNEVA